MFKNGEIINNIHQFYCPHCNELLEVLKDNIYLSSSHDKCPYCNKWVLYNFNNKTVKQSIEHELRLLGE